MDNPSQEILVDDDPELRELLTTFLADQSRKATASAGRIGGSSVAGQPIPNVFVIVVDARPSPQYLTPPTNVPAGRTARFAGWTLDLARHRLSADDDVSVSLPPTEFAVLLSFLERPREALSRGWLVEASRGQAHAFTSRTLDVYVSRLRRRLSARAGGAELIATRRGQGYVFNADVAFE